MIVRNGCILDSAEVADGAMLGPYAHLRPESHIGEGAHVGNFVETKKVTLGNGSKANHLNYLGDAVIGAGVNIGAGAITCNYDGVHKHLTTIGDGVFVGSDSTLVAPVTIGDGAYVAAGSCITEDVPAGSLALGRSRQVTKPGWVAAEAPHRSKERSLSNASHCTSPAADSDAQSRARRRNERSPRGSGVQRTIKKHHIFTNPLQKRQQKPRKSRSRKKSQKQIRSR